MFSEASYNPTGSYVRFFDLEEALIGKRVILSFEGAEQAIYVWINGEFVDMRRTVLPCLNLTLHRM